MSFMDSAPWVFESKVELNVSPQDGWAIVNNDDAWKHWHPEVTKIEWNEQKTARTIVFRDTLLMVLLAGPLTMWEEFDVVEDQGPVKKYSMYFHVL
mgnify:CR=1 FL=1